MWECTFCGLDHSGSQPFNYDYPMSKVDALVTIAYNPRNHFISPLTCTCTCNILFIQHNVTLDILRFNIH